MEKNSLFLFRYLTQVEEFNKYLGMNPTLSGLLNKILDCFLELTQFQRGFVMLFDEQDRLKVYSEKSISSKEIDGSTLIQNLINEIVQKHQPIFSESSKHYEPAQRKMGGAIIGLPIHRGVWRSEKKILGLLYLDTSRPMKFIKFEKELLLTFLYFTNLAIRNIQIRESSIRDPLTNLYNRYYLFARIKEEYLKAKRYKEPSCLLTLNITDFKRINEVFGYESGNRILTNFSSFLAKLFREYDILFRYESDKFIVLLPGTALKDAERTAQRIKRIIENNKFVLSGEEVILNVTIGLMQITPQFEPAKMAEELDKCFIFSKSKKDDKTHLGELAISKPREHPYGIDMFVGKSETANSLRHLIQTFANLNTSVLLSGETGTGKDLVARLLHELSERRHKPFVPIECAAVPETLLESELFGYEKGAFTGAYKSKRGLIEIAQDGTLYLDNINNLPLSLQAKLLRAVEEKSFLRLGGEKELKIDVRIIASTTKDLKEEVKAGRFREDLYQRLNILTIFLPSLRDRREDILIIAEYFLKIISPIYRKYIKGFSEDAKKSLLFYDWPGNVRELKYRIERAIIHNKTGIIESTDLELEPKRVPLSLKEHLTKLQQNLIEEALKLHSGNLSKAAKELGVSRTTFYKLLKKLKK